MNKNRKISTGKIIRKRVLAGSMAIIVGAGAAGTCGYHGSLNVEAKEGIYKDESVYVKADTDGAVTKTTVTEWLKNPGEGKVEDMSGLDDIVNVKGEETFTKDEKENISWKAEGEDIYYQGTSKESLPVDVHISYRLDGKKISAEDLQGKDGKVEIKIDYENHAKQTVDVGGKQVEMYTPFTMVTTLMLSSDEYKNVTIDNGKVISDADKNIVLGVAFPGLTENLGVDDLDIDIPDSVTITADVKNATVNPTVTVASTEITEQFDLSDVKDFEDLSSSMDKLENAADQLADGSGKAADGSSALLDGISILNNKSGELTKGVNDLAAGVNKYTSGVNSLADGSADLSAGAKALDAGAEQMQGGIAKAKDGAEKLSEGIQTANSQMNGVIGEISTGLNQTANAMAGADKAVQGITATASLNNQDSIIAQAADAAAEAAVQAAGDVPAEVKDKISADTKAAVTKNLSAELGDSDNWSTKVTGKETAEQYIAGAKGGIQQIQKGIEDNSTKLSKGMQDLSDGALALNVGLGKGTETNPGLTAAADALKSGTSDLSGGAAALAKGAATLNESSSLLNIGTKQLKDGGSELVSGVGQLEEGADHLASGTETLADGMEQFKEDGIQKLVNLFGGDIQNVTDRLDAMTALGQEYKSFAGIKDHMDGSTKFIIETEGINESD